MKVIVCGGRDFYNLKYAYYVLDFINTHLHPITTVIQGGAFGADAIANHWAFDRKIERIEVEADWDRFGKAAGMIRNGEMLKLNPDLVIAFPGGKGTAGMIALARKKNVKVIEIDMDELVQKVRLDQLQARKDRDTVRASLLTTLLGEFEGAMKTGASNGKKGDSANEPAVIAPSNSSEVLQALIKKFLKNIDATLAIRQLPDIIREKEILESYLPKQLTDDELSATIDSIVANGAAPNVGAIMKELQTKYKGQYDGKTASQLITRKIQALS